MQLHNSSRFKIILLLAVILIIFNHPGYAHVIIEDLENKTAGQTAFIYLKLGYEHILPLGFDHILFVVGLFLLNPKLNVIVKQATIFTIAHTITLGLSMYEVINPPPSIVEPMIALSILYVAVENIISSKLRPVRLGVVFLFGLVHGMGFASVLGGLGLPQNSYLSSLLLFNLGVELGQITVILAAWFAFAKWFGKKPYYRKYIVIPLSVIIGLIAIYWTIERIFY